MASYSKRIGVKSEAPICADPDVAAEVVRALLERAAAQGWNMTSLELQRHEVTGTFQVPRPMLKAPTWMPDEGLVQRWAEAVCAEMTKAVEQGVNRWRAGSSGAVQGKVIA